MPLAGTAFDEGFDVGAFKARLAEASELACVNDFVGEHLGDEILRPCREARIEINLPFTRGKSHCARQIAPVDFKAVHLGIGRDTVSYEPLRCRREPLRRGRSGGRGLALDRCRQRDQIERVGAIKMRVVTRFGRRCLQRREQRDCGCDPMSCRH